MLPWATLQQSQAPGIIGDIGDTLVNAARARKADEQKAAEMLLQKQRLDADKLRMQAEEHRAAAQERRAQTEEQRAQDSDARAKRIEAAQLVGQAPSMLDNPAQFQALAQAHGLNPQQQQPNLPPMPADPGAAPQEPQMPMAGPLETPEQAGGRAVQESFQGQGPAQDASQAQMKAQQEVLKQQAERDQYAQALAAHPDLVKQHAAQVDQFQQAKAQRAQAEANPVFNLQMPGGPQTIDFGQMRQQQQHALQAKAEAGAKAYPPQYQMQYSAMVSQGIDPVKADAAIDRRMKEDQHAQEMKDFHIPATDQIRLKEAEIAARRRAGKSDSDSGPSGADPIALAKAIAAGKNGKPLEQADMIAAAQLYHIPLEAKAGHVSLASIAKESRFNADNARKDAGGKGGEVADVNSWAKTNGIDAITKQQRELGALSKELTDNKGNPLQQALALEKAVSAARGGAASKQALALALSHLGGSLDTAEAVVSKIRGNGYSEGQMKNFTNFIQGQEGAAQQQGSEAYGNYQKYINSLPSEKQQAARNEEGRLFSGMHGYGAKGGGGGLPSGSKRVSYKGQPGYLTPDNVFHADGG